MTTDDARYNLLDKIEEEYIIFIEKLEGIDNNCFDIRLDEVNKTPKEILIEQIDLMTKCISHRGVHREKDDVKYTYEELKYIFNLMHINLTSWVESLSDDSKLIEEYEAGNRDTIIEWFDRYLIKELKLHNKELSIWKVIYKKNKGDQ